MKKGIVLLLVHDASCNIKVWSRSCEEQAKHLDASILLHFTIYIRYHNEPHDRIHQGSQRELHLQSHSKAWPARLSAFIADYFKNDSLSVVSEKI